MLSAALVVICAIAATQASPIVAHHNMKSLPLPRDDFEKKSFSPCQAFGLDNDIACLFCSYEELLPFLQGKPDLITSSVIASSASCLTNMCQTCGMDAECLLVNGQSLAPYCRAALAATGDASNMPMNLINQIELMLSSDDDEAGLYYSDDQSQQEIDIIAFPGSGSGNDMEMAIIEETDGEDSYVFIIFLSLYRLVFAEEPEPVVVSNVDSLPFSARVARDSSAGSGFADDAITHHPSTTTTTTTTTTTASASTSTSTSTSSFTMTPPSAPGVNMVEMMQNITLSHVCPMKFKLMYFINAMAATLNVPASSLYAQVNEEIVSMTITNATLTISYSMVIEFGHSLDVLATMNNITSSNFILNLQATAGIFNNTEILDASLVEVISGPVSRFYLFFLSGVAVVILLVIVMIMFVLSVTRKTKQTIRLAPTVCDEKKSAKYELLANYDYDDLSA
jgi:hypothetical protein